MMWMMGTIEDFGDSDPLVYQLVRGKGDERSVPCTDDDLMDVEQLLVDDESKQQSIESIWHDDTYFSQDHLFPKKFLSKGLVQTESNEVSMKLHKRFEEESLQASNKSFSHSSSYMAIDLQTCNTFNNTESCCDNLHPDSILCETASSSVVLNASQNTQAVSAEICSETRTVAYTSKTSVSETCTSLHPDFCILKRDLCLNNLLIRELQEVFKAIFGRPTTVKDKLWLKRRITMALKNSADVSSTNTVIRGNKIACKEGKVEAGFSKFEDVSLSLDEMSNLKNYSSQGLQFNPTEQFIASGEILKEPKIKDDSKDEDDQMKYHPSKRMRKPTRRFIEELPEFETTKCNAKVQSSKDYPGQDNSSRTYHTRSFCLGDTQGRNFSTRYDSIGGFGILVPYVYRIRRSRPRKDFMAFKTYHQTEVTSIQAETAHSPDSEYDVGSVRIARKDRSLPLQRPNCYSKTNMDKVNINTLKPSKEKQDAEVEETDACEVNTKHFQAGTKVRERRKHHKAWTLSEVMRLVEGVARYGPGKWSEIRQLAFTSDSYRTSVDLKDKWRNLVRASLLQSSIHEGNRTSIPVSAAILCRVRELAELRQLTGIVVRPKKRVVNEGKGAEESKSGFL